MAATTVLLADDDDRFRLLVRSVLEDDGYVVVGEAVDAPSAIDLAAELRPDIVVLDLMLPGLDGCGVYKELRADPRTAAIPVSASQTTNALCGDSISMRRSSSRCFSRPSTIRTFKGPFMLPPFASPEPMPRLRRAQAARPAARLSSIDDGTS